MHSCLTIHELLEEVLLNLSAPSQRASLASVAVTCRTFSEPAMDILWSELDNLFPLVKCMPADLWEETSSVSLLTPTAPAEHLLKFTREPTPSEWDTFLAHARRVRKIRVMHKEFRTAEPDCSEGPQYVVDWTVLAALNEHFSTSASPQTIFPRLQQLSFHVYGWEKRPLAFILSCLSPTIAELEITDAYTHVADPDVDLGDSVSMERIFSYIATRCRSVPYTQDRISLHEPMGSVLRLKDAISQTRQLRSLSIHMSVPEDTVLALGTAPGLRKLVLSPLNLSIRATPPQPALFEALQELYLSVPTIDDFTAFLSLLQPHTPLRRLYVGIDLIPWREDDSLRRCCELLRRAQGLEHLTLELSRLIRVNFVSSMTFETFAHLFALPNLKTFRSSSGPKSSAIITLDTFDIAAMGRAWSQLRELRLQSIVVEGDPMKLCRMDALLAYREHLPHLERLEVALDVSQDCSHIPDAVRASRVASHPLRVLDVSAALTPAGGIRDPVSIARALHAMFPHLEKLLYSSTSGQDWALVEKSLSECTAL